MQMKVEYRERELEPIVAEVRLSFLFLSPVHPPGTNFSSSSSFHCRIFNRSSSFVSSAKRECEIQASSFTKFHPFSRTKSHPFLPSYFVSNAEYRRFSTSPRFLQASCIFPGQIANDSTRTSHSDMQMSYNENVTAR